MYNRYIRNDQGTYTRIMAEEPGASHPENLTGSNPSGGPGNFSPGSPFGRPGSDPHSNMGNSAEHVPHDGSMGRGESESGGAPGGPPPQPTIFPPPPPPPEWKLPFGLGAPGKGTEGISAMLRKLLDKFHLDNVDTGDILLLIMLFFLFKEDADEELMIALGLLLIL